MIGRHCDGCRSSHESCAMGSVRACTNDSECRSRLGELISLVQCSLLGRVALAK